jgi:EpsI family protein
MTSWLKKHAPWVLTVLLLGQAVCFYSFAFGERVPQSRPLVGFDLDLRDWTDLGDQAIDRQTLEVLNADDTIYRAYKNESSNHVVTLFVAYFASQRTGKTPHSPKNCLPGTGWLPIESGTVHIPIPGRAMPVSVNRYVVTRGDAQDVVLYWYQAHGRVIASEYNAKFYMILDSLRYQRSDMSMVRIVSPSVNGNISDATSTAISFVQRIFPPLQIYLPG